MRTFRWNAYAAVCALAASSWLADAATAQQGEWQTLANAPVVSRHNDVWFNDVRTGWIANGDGEIYRTLDGGENWELQFRSGSTHFRSIGFLDAQRGWAGNVGAGEFGTTDTNVLYRTEDSGQSWSPFSLFHGPAPAGICGMQVVNDSTIVAVGRVRGPAFFIRTVDGGQTWSSADLGALAAGLIDVHFFHPDTGFAVGLSNVDHNQSSGVVLYTDDGGATWRKRFTTTRTGEWLWKLSFPSRRVGYGSLQRNSRSPIFFLKTEDGGRTWQEKLFFQTNYFVQGIGFIDEQRGWIGGNSSFPTYETTDGGETWRSAGFGSRVNRFRFLDDSTGYAVGRSVYKLASRTTTGIAGQTRPPASPRLLQNYPNPFNPATRLTFELPEAARVELSVFDQAGRAIRVLASGYFQPGVHEAVWDGKGRYGVQASAGIYFARLRTPARSETRKLVLLK